MTFASSASLRCMFPSSGALPRDLERVHSRLEARLILCARSSAGMSYV